MADPVDNISISVEASAKEATDALNQTSKALDGVGESSEKAGKKVKSSAEQLSLLARQAKAAGLKDLANEFSNMSQKVAQADLADFKKNIAAVAKSLADSGKTDFAERISEIYEAPIEANKELKKVSDDLAEVNRDIAQQEKDKAAVAKQAARDKATAERKAAREAESAQKKAAREEEAEKKRVAKEVEKAAERKKKAEEKAAEATRRAIEKQQAQLQSLYAKRDKMDFAGVDKDSSKYQSLIYDIAEMEKKMGVESTAAPVQGFAKIKKELHGLGEAAKKTTSKFSKFMASIGRIAMYRAIRSAIKAVTSAIKEGLTNLYEYSQEVGTAFAPAVDSLRQHVLRLKNTFATALRPVLEALIPVVIQLVDWFSRFIDLIAQVLSIMTGKVDENGRYTKAVLGDLEQSNKEAKELKRTLLGFDEINRLDGDTGNSQASSVATQFIQAELSEEAKKIADALNKVNWKLIGKVLGAFAALNAMKFLGFGGLVGMFVLMSAFFGDDIADAIDKAQRKVDDFFSNLDRTGSSTINNLIDWVASLSHDALGLLSHLSRAIYYFAHDDMYGAKVEIIKAAGDAAKLLIDIVGGLLKILLGLLSDLLYAWQSAGVWLHNEVFAPLFDKIHRYYMQTLVIDPHNRWIEMKKAIVAALGWLATEWNAFAKEWEWKINMAIAAVNALFHLDIPPVDLTVNTQPIYEAYKELEDEEWPDVPVDWEFVARWEAPQKLDLGAFVNTEGAKAKVDELVQRAIQLATKLNNITNTVAKSENAAKQANQSKVYFTKYASGGYPDAGSLFLAGENGASPEIVGTFGGRTGVMNSEQLSAALYNAFTAALAANPQGGDIYLDGEVIYRNTVRRNNNAVRSTGRSALLT